MVVGDYVPCRQNENKENVEKFRCVPNNDFEWDECVPQPVSRTTTSTEGGLSHSLSIPFSYSLTLSHFACLSNVNRIHCEIHSAKTSSPALRMARWQKIQFPSLVCACPLHTLFLFYIIVLPMYPKRAEIVWLVVAPSYIYMEIYIYRVWGISLYRSCI